MSMVARCSRHQLADGLRVERVGVIDGADARQQRHPQAAGEAEGVEERQHAHDLVGRARSTGSARRPRRWRAGCGARASRPWARRCCRSRTARWRRRRAAAGAGRRAWRPARSAAGSRRWRGQRLAQRRDRGRDVLDEHHARALRSSLALSTKRREVTMVVMPHWSSADSVASAPAVKLRLTGTLPAKSSGDVDEHAGDRGRQHDADHLVGGPLALEPVGEGEAADEGLPVAEVRAGRSRRRRPCASGGWRRAGSGCAGGRWACGGGGRPRCRARGWSGASARRVVVAGIGWPKVTVTG